MPQRNVATNFTFEQQRQEINLLAADFTAHETTVNTAAPTYLKHDGSNAFTGGTLNVPNAFTISANSGSGTLTISGNLDVTGTTTTVNTANLEVTDKNILIAKGSTSDAQADGAGITIDSATDITFNFVDANDALVSSIGLEGTTFVKAPYGQFTGSGTPSGGQGVEINAPDTNTGQIISYDRGNTAYKELRVKGSSVGVYTGTSNALVGSFNSNGLSMESGKTITGVIATASQSNITSVGTLVSLDVSGNSTLGDSTTVDTVTVNGSLIQNNDSAETAYASKSLPSGDSGFYIRNGNGGTGTYASLGLIASSTAAASDQSFSIVAQAQSSGLVPKVAFTQRDGNNSQNETMVFSPSGQVLINRTAQHASSAEKLSINGMTSIQFDSTSTASLYIFNEDTTSDGSIQPFIFGSDGSGLRFGLGVQRSTGLTVLNGQFGLSFRTGSSGVGGTERLHITNDGKVGINDNDPDLTLHVKDGDLVGRSAANSNCDVLIEGETNTGIQFYSGTQVQLRFGDAASTAAGAIIYQHSDDQFKFNYDTNGFITFNSGGGGETLRIANDKVMTSVDIKPDTHQQRDIGTASNSFRNIYSETLTASTIYDSKGEIRKIIIKANATNNYNLISSDAGKAIHSSADVVVPNAVFSAGDAITLINSSQSNMSIAEGSNVTMYNSADGSTGNRTLSGKGMATLYWIGSSTCYISGAGLS